MARVPAYATVGQSYTEQGYGRNASAGPFSLALMRAIAASPAAMSAALGVTVTAADFPQLRQLSTGGSAIRQANDGGSGYWVSNTNTQGPLLSAAVAAIAGYVQKPSFFIWSHGEADAQSVSIPAGVTALSTAITSRLLPDLRSAVNGGAPNSVPFFVDILGFRYAADQEREDQVRDVLLDVIANTPGVFRGADKYGIELDQTYHPTMRGYQILGAFTGRRVASILSTGVAAPAPSIGAVSRSLNDLSVTINVPDGCSIAKPSRPRYFGLFDAAGVRMPHQASWTGNVVSFRTPRPVASLRYPTREAVYEPSNIVRLTDPVDPLFAGEPGMHLQSRLPIAVA